MVVVGRLSLGFLLTFLKTTLISISQRLTISSHNITHPCLSPLTTEASSLVSPKKAVKKEENKGKKCKKESQHRNRRKDQKRDDDGKNEVMAGIRLSSPRTAILVICWYEHSKTSFCY